MRKNLRVKGVPREPDAEAIAIAIWIQQKRLGQRRRESAARDRAKRQGRDGE